MAGCYVPIYQNLGLRAASLFLSQAWMLRIKRMTSSLNAPISGHMSMHWPVQVNKPSGAAMVCHLRM